MNDNEAKVLIYLIKATTENYLYLIPIYVTTIVVLYHCLKSILRYKLNVTTVNVVREEHDIEGAWNSKEFRFKKTLQQKEKLPVYEEKVLLNKNEDINVSSEKKNSFQKWRIIKNGQEKNNTN